MIVFYHFKEIFLQSLNKKFFKNEGGNEKHAIKSDWTKEFDRWNKLTRRPQKAD